MAQAKLYQDIGCKKFEMKNLKQNKLAGTDQPVYGILSG